MLGSTLAILVFPLRGRVLALRTGADFHSLCWTQGAMETQDERGRLRVEVSHPSAEKLRMDGAPSIDEAPNFIHCGCNSPVRVGLLRITTWYCYELLDITLEQQIETSSSHAAAGPCVWMDAGGRELGSGKLRRKVTFDRLGTSVGWAQTRGFPKSPFRKGDGP